MSAKILTFDIERVPMRTKPLAAWDMKSLQYRRLTPADIDRWSRTICLAYRWKGERRIGFIAEWHEGGRTGFLLEAQRLIDEADILVGHNSKGFDHPHLLGEFILEGIAPPSPVQHFDTLLTARSVANWEANHLDTLDKRFGFEGKTDKYRIEMAEAAVDGDAKAQRRIERYNKGDIRATDRVAGVLLPYAPINLGLYELDPENPVCPSCKSTNMQRRGYLVKIALRYPRFQCQDCGRWTHSRKAVPGSVEMRPAR